MEHKLLNKTHYIQYNIKKSRDKFALSIKAIFEYNLKLFIFSNLMKFI